MNDTRPGSYYTYNHPRRGLIRVAACGDRILGGDKVQPVLVHILGPNSYTTRRDKPGCCKWSHLEDWWVNTETESLIPFNSIFMKLYAKT